MFVRIHGYDWPTKRCQTLSTCMNISEDDDGQIDLLMELLYAPCLIMYPWLRPHMMCATLAYSTPRKISNARERSPAITTFIVAPLSST